MLMTAEVILVDPNFSQQDFQCISGHYWCIFKCGMYLWVYATAVDVSLKISCDHSCHCQLHLSLFCTDRHSFVNDK